MMKRRINLCLFFLLTAVASMWAQDYYKPKSDRVTALETGKQYMIFNTAMADGTEDRTGFLYNAGTSLGHNKTKRADGYVYNSQFLFTLEAGETEGTYYIKSVSSDKYVNISGGTANSAGIGIYIAEWSAAKSEGTIAEGNFAGVGSYNDNGTTTANADITTANAVYIITTATDSGKDCWNGNANSFASWESGHPYAFYEVDVYEDADFMAAVEWYNAVAESLDIYTLQQKYGLVQDASKWVCNYPSDPVDGAGYPGLVDGNAETHFHTGYSGRNPAPDGTKYYLQADLGYQVNAFNIYIQGRSGGGTKPAGFVIEGSNDPGDDSSWTTIASSWTPTWNNNGCLSAAFATGGEGYRYIRFTHTSDSYFALGEFYIFPSNYVVDSYRSFLAVTVPVSGDAVAIKESLSAIDYQNLMPFAGAQKPANGYKYYIYANTKYNGSYVPRYIYNTGADDAISVTTDLVENNDNYIWTCEVDADGNYCFKNSAGRYLAYNSGDNKKFELVDTAYAFTLKDDANTKSAGAWSLYSNSASRYVVTKTDGSSINQYLNKEGADESWCSDYIFIAAEGEQSTAFASGETYYISAYALQSDGSYKNWYLYAADDGSLATVDSNAGTLNYRWTITINSDGSYYMRNGNGKYLSYANKSLQLADAAYAFKLMDDAKVKGAVENVYSLYNPTSSGGKYMVTSSTTASTWNQNSGAVNDTSWTSDYVFEKYTAPARPTVTINPYINGVGVATAAASIATIKYADKDYTGVCSFVYPAGADLPAAPVVTNPLFTFDGYYKDGVKVGETLDGEAVTADVTYEARYSFNIFTADLANPLPVRVYNNRYNDYVIRMNADGDGVYTGNAVNSGAGTYGENEIWYLVGTADEFLMYSRTAGNALSVKLAGTGSGSAATLAAEGTQLCLTLQSDGAFAINPVGATGQSFNMHGGKGNNIKLYDSTDGGSTWLFKRIDADNVLTLNYKAQTEGGYDLNYKIGEIAITLDGNITTTMLEKGAIPASDTFYLPEDAKYALSTGLVCHGWTMNINGSDAIAEQTIPDGGSTVNVNIAVDTDNKYQYLFYSRDENGKPFRIPAITTTSDGTVLAFSDYRPCGSDIGFGEVDIMLRRSSDNGETWGDPIKIADGQGGNSNVFDVGFGDAAVVADRESGKVLVMAVAGKKVFSSGTADSHNFMAKITSNDNGASWDNPVDVTSKFFGTGALFPEAYTMFFGSGRLLQSKVVKVGNYYRIYGALLIKHPSSTYTGNCNYVVYSDDFGETWKILGGSVTDGMCCNGGDEPKVEELADGTIILSSRKAPGRYFNVFKFTDLNSATGSWGTAVDSNFSGGLQIGNNACNGEILRIGNYLFQSLPYGPGRSNVRIYRKELEEGVEITPTYIATGWEEIKRVSTESSAYSTMTVLADNETIGFLFEEAPEDYSIVYLPIKIKDMLPEDAYSDYYAQLNLPKLSIVSDDGDDSNDTYHYYRIVNTRKADTYVAYEGDNANMSLSNGDAAERAKQLFYFTGEKSVAADGSTALKVKINNFMAGGYKLSNGGVFFKDKSVTGANTAWTTGAENPAGTSVTTAIPGTFLSASDTWTISFDVTSDGSSVNEWGAGLLSTQHSDGSNVTADALGTTYTGGFQLYLKKGNGGLDIKHNNSYGASASFTASSSMNISLAYSPTGKKLTVTVTAGDVAETEEITCELNDVQSLYTAIPVGVNITNLKATRGSNSNYTVSEWNAEGDYWYITSASKFDNPGLAVVTPTADVANSGWNEFGGSGTQVGLWSGKDPGSHWKFEEVATFEEYITNETELEKSAFAELSADNPFYSNDRVVEINDMYSALATDHNSLEQLSARIERLAEIRAEWALETGLPLLTTADDIANNNIKWYAAKNIRNGNYATYAGPSVFMKESSEPVTASMFYFMEDGSVEDINGKPALKVKIYNYATMDVPANKVMAGINVWNETGSTYYIYSSAENHANPGLVISNRTDDSETAWSDYAGGGSDEIQNYKPSDGGSTWILSRIGNFAPVFDLDNRIDSLASSLNVTENCAAAFFVEGGNAGYTADEVNALKDDYPTGTYTECKATDTQLNTMKAAVDGLYKESMILYFNNLGNSSYWLGANIPNAVNATSNEAVHTNVWRIDHVGNGAYTMYNEAGNRYVGICPNNTGGSLAVPVNVDDAGKFVFVPQYTGEEITSYLIKSADVENAYLKLNSGNIYTVVSSNEISDFTRWTNRNMTDKIEISEALYTQAASIIWTQLPTMNSNFGLVRLGSMLSSTDSTSIANLVDNNAATVFDSKDNATDYIQVDMGEGNGISSLFFYMRASGQEKRPTKVTVSASNNGTDFEPVGEQVTTALGYQLMHLSDRVSAGETYRYWRFTVDETNSGSADFVLSEFLVFKDVTYVSDFFTEANDFYETRFETLDAVKAAVDLLKVEAKYYIDRVAAGTDVHDVYAEQDLGEYLTSAYEDFEDAYNNCYGSASTSQEIEETYITLSEAQNEYLNSKNRPVFYVHNAYEDGYSNGVAVFYNGSDFDTDELSKWDYRQMFYDRNLNWAEFGNDDKGNVLATTFERHLISYNGDKPLYNSSFTEFTPMSDWRVANGYTTDAAEERCAYNIDINNSHDGEDYLGIKGDGLNLDVYGAQCEKSDDAGYSNRHTAWYVTYVCQKKNLDRVKAVKEGEMDALDYMNEFYMAYKKLMNRMANVGDDFNEYKWTAEGEYDWSTLKGDSADYAQFLSISMVDLADGLEDGSYKISDITQKTIKVTEYVDDFELNIPQPGRYYRFAGMSKQRLPQDYYITGVAEMHNTARAGQQKTILMKPLYASDEVYEQNESTTIFYYGEHTTETGNNRTYLLSYDTGRFIGVKEHWIGEDMSKANNWNFEKVGEKRGNVAPVKFAASVVSYTSPAYSIRMGDDSQFKYLYAGGDYIDRGGNPTSDSEYYRYDWAVELVTELPLTITSAGFASYYVPVELQIPEGVRAFVLYESAVTDEESDFNLDNNEYFESGVSVFRLRQIKGDVIPAATPVILQAVAGTYRFKINYEPTLVTEEEKKDTYCYLDDITNLLEGTHEQNYIAERDGYTHYILAKKSKGVGMYKVKTYESLTSDNPFGSGTITTNFATPSFLNREHRAWLPLQNTASQSGGVFSIERGGTTGIDEVNGENGEVKGIYDLQGRKIDEIIQPGIYIIDGKRVLVK